MTGTEQTIWAEPDTAGRAGNGRSGMPMTIIEAAGKQAAESEKERQEQSA